MSDVKDVIFERPLELLEEKSKKVLELFRQVASSGVNDEDSELSLSLEDVKNYWEDRLRPTLVALSFEAVGGRPRGADNLGLFATLLGAGIGIHDDVIDKSLTKHFRKTILGLHGFDNAVLVGDLLIVKALAGIRLIVNEGFKPKQISKVLETYENCLVEICKAQFVGMRYRRNLNVELRDYEEFLTHSIAEIEACTSIGAILGNGSEREIRGLAGFGRDYGFMMRLFGDVTDSLNIEGNLDQRLENESVPLPILYAAKSSEEVFRRIEAILQKPHIVTEDIVGLPEFCLKAKAFDYVYNLAEKKEKEIIQNLVTLSHGAARNALLSMAKTALADIKKFSFMKVN